jgi:hypothetical protein
MTRTEIASFFEECIESIVDAISGNFRDIINANTESFPRASLMNTS